MAVICGKMRSRFSCGRRGRFLRYAREPGVLWCPMKKLGNRAVGLMATFGVVAFCCGCATLASPTSVQRVPVTSDPSGAELFVDGDLVGVTPVTVELSRRDSEVSLRMEKDGFVPEEFRVERVLSRWLLLDVVTIMIPYIRDLGTAEVLGMFAGGLGTVLGLEFLTGAAFRLPESVHRDLRPVLPAPAPRAGGPAAPDPRPRSGQR